MPNSSDDALPRVVPPLSGHTTCPPEHEHAPGRRNHDDNGSRAPADVSMDPAPPRSAHVTGQSQPSHPASESATQAKEDTDGTIMPASPSATVPSPTGSRHETEAREGEPADPLSPTAPLANTSSPIPSSNWMFPSTRPPPTYFSSFLRPGSKFVGTQESDRHRYNVEVDIKHVDVAESSLCGYLRIEGLAKDHPCLITYFEGEIVGGKYGFLTAHPSWGATEKTDLHHWDRFPAWRPLAKQARRPDFRLPHWAQREHVFMRWKENFLVPDHRVREITGASFEGFYYICFNQVAGTISGIYFHAKSEKYQQLELRHVPNMGCFPAINFC